MKIATFDIVSSMNIAGQGVKPNVLFDLMSIDPDYVLFTLQNRQHLNEITGGCRNIINVETIKIDIPKGITSSDELQKRA